eukprot:gene3734-4653_t
MVSKILPNILKKLLGNYIEGLDTLSIPFWRGEIVLKNLRIKKEVFQSSDLPFELLSGVIKKVVITIPWLRFLKDPITISVDGIFLLFGRRDIHSITGEEAAGSSAKEDKESQISNVINIDDLQKIQSTLERDSGYTSTKESFKVRIAKQIFKCLRLYVNNLHICYQDQKTSPGEQFSIGITLESFNLVSTDEKWVQQNKATTTTTTPASTSTVNSPPSAAGGGSDPSAGVPAAGITEDIKVSYKLASIFNFSIYWDSQFGVTKLVKPEDMDVLLMHSLPRQRIKIEHKYLLQPITGFVKMTLIEEDVDQVNNEGVIKSLVTKANLYIGLSQIDLHLMDIQYRDMLNLLSFIQDWKKVLRYKIYRPLVPVKGNAQKWWHFAFRSIISDFRRKRNEVTWKEVEQNKKLRDCYVKIYTERLLRGKISKLEERLIEEIEKKTTYEDIILYRMISERNLQERKKEEVESLTTNKAWWLNGWLGFRGYDWSESVEKISLNKEELAFLENHLNVNLKALAGKPQNTFAIEFSTLIRKFSIQILDWRENQIVVPLAYLELLDLNFLFEKATSTKLSVSASSFQLIDKCSSNTKFENIIVEKESFNNLGGIDLELDKRVLDINIVFNPPEDPTDYTISMRLEPFYFINSKPFVDTMIPFFTHANQEALDSLKYSFIKKIQMLQEYLMNELRHLIRNQKVADIRLDINIPSIIFPESYDHEDTLLLVCNPGKFTLKTQPHNQEWDSMNFSEINELDDQDEMFTRYKALLRDRVKWWKDYCSMAYIDEPIETQAFLKSYIQFHKEAIERGGGIIDDSINNNNIQQQELQQQDGDIPSSSSQQSTPSRRKKPLNRALGALDDEDDDDDTVNVQQISEEPKIGDEWNEMVGGVNINNAQFYEGITFSVKDINVKICRFSQISLYNYLVAPFNFVIFLELCSQPYDLKLPQIKCRSELSPLNVEISDKDLYEIAKIIGKNGILEYFMDMDRKSTKELADIYEVVQIKKEKKGFEGIPLSLLSDTKSILHSRKKTKERLTQSTLLKFFFSSSTIDVKLNYISEQLVMNLDKIRCRSLAKFMHMEVLFDIENIQITDTNSVIPVLSMVPREKLQRLHTSSSSSNVMASGSGSNPNVDTSSAAAHNHNHNIGGSGFINSLNVNQTNSPIFLHLTSINKNSLEYDYIDFIVTLQTQCVGINLPKECILCLTNLFGTVVADVNRFHEKKKSVLTIEGQGYRDISSRLHTKKVKKVSEKLDANEFDPNDLKTKIILIVPNFSLTLCSRESDIASFQFEDISINGLFQLPLFDCDLIVKDMRFIDFSIKDAVYQNILTTQKSQNPVVNMHVVSHAKEKADIWGYNRMIQLHIGKIQITLLVQAFNSIRNYVSDIRNCMLNSFPSMAIPPPEYPSPSDTAPPNQPNIQHPQPQPPQHPPIQGGASSPPPVVYKRTSVTEMEIVIDNNQIIIPKNPKSKSAIRLSVGKVILGLNQTSPTEDLVPIKVYGVSISTHYEDRAYPVISDPMRVDIVLVRTLQTSHDETSLHAEIKLTRVHLKLSQFQYNLFYNVYQQNINQQIVPPPISKKFRIERLNRVLIVKLEIKEFVELNLEDEQTMETKFFSLLLNKPLINCDVFNNGDSVFSIKTTGLVIRDKNRLVIPPNQYQEILSIDDGTGGTHYFPTSKNANDIIGTSAGNHFEILEMSTEGSLTKIAIRIAQIHLFLDLHWIDKLITFLSPIIDPDVPVGSKPPIVVNVQWILSMLIDINIERANIMVGNLSNMNDLVLLMSSEVGIMTQFGSDGLMKVLLRYLCHKGLLGYRVKQEETGSISWSVSTSRENLYPKNSVISMWMNLKKSARVFLDSFQTSLHICLVPEGNQFFFCELDRMVIVFSGKAYKFLLDLYQTIQDILFERSKSKEITNESLQARKLRLSSGTTSLPIPFNSKRRDSLQPYAAKRKDSIQSDSISVGKEQNQLYQIKTRSVEMIRAHQSRVGTKYPNDEDIEKFKSEGGETTIQKKVFSQFSFTIKNLECVVIDDLSKHQMNTPLFKLNLAFGNSKIIVKSSIIEVDFESVIQLDYYNNRIAFWEPFLESWLFKTEIGLGKELSLDLYSTDLLNMNLTIPFMDNVSIFLRTYSKEFGYPFSLIVAPVDPDKNKPKKPVNPNSLFGKIKKLKEKKLRKSFSPFYIRNQTGSKIRYRLETHDGKQVEGVVSEKNHCSVVNIEGYGTFFELKSGFSSPINFLPDVQINLETFNQLVLSVELLGIEKSISVPLDKIKTYEHPIFIDSTTSSKLFSIVGIKKGTKYITFRFPIVFQNNTSFPIDIATVAAGFGGTQPPNLSSVINIGQTRTPLPINRMKNILIKIRPTGDEFKWCNETFDANSNIDENDKFTCISKGGDKVCYIKSFVKQKNNFSIVKLSAMIKVKNLLPFPIAYRLKSLMETIPISRRSYEAGIDSESKVEVYDIAIQEKFKVQVKIDDDWSEVVMLSEKDDNLYIGTISIVKNKIPLHLNMEFISNNGVRKILFYNQYWVFNKSGLVLWAKRAQSKDYYDKTVSFNHTQPGSDEKPVSTAIQVKPEDWYDHHLKKEEPIMFSFRKTKDIENTIRIKVGDTKWSDKLSIAAIGDRGCVIVHSEKNSGLCGGYSEKLTYNLGVSVDLAPNLKTKIVVFAPRFVFYNSYPYCLLFKQAGTENIIKVEPHQSVPLYYFYDSHPAHIVTKLDHAAYDWSSPFVIQTNSDFSFRLFTDDKQPEFEGSQYLLVKTYLEVATIFVIATELDEPPFKIMNMTKYSVTVNQKKCGSPIQIEPDSTLSYVWDQPMEEHDLEVTVDKTHSKTSFKVDKIKTFKPLEFHDEGESIIIKATVVAEERTRVLKLTDSNFQISSTEEEETARQSFRLHLTGIGISIINSSPTELLYVTVDGILLEYFLSSFIQKMEMKISSLQVDNQLSKVTPYSHPVLLYAENINPTPTPFLQLRVVRSNRMANIDYYHHLSLKMQELTIKVEEKFLYVLLDFFNSLDLSFYTGNKKTKKALHNVDMLTPIYVNEIGNGFADEMIDRILPSISGKKMYFESLNIDPLSVFLTFDLSKQSGSFKSLEKAPMVRAFRRIGFVLVSFQHAHIFLNQFRLTHAFGSNEELITPIIRHYLTEGLSEIYKILGTFNFLGNPVGLFTNFGIGFKEFFTKTGRGLVGNNFRSGISQGSKSLGKHAVYGLFDSGTKFTASAAKALSTASMDKQYILERQYIVGESAGNFTQGVILGGRTAKTAFKRSLSGLAMLPYKGGKEQGVLGAFKGVGKGVAGLVVKPIAGCFDFVSKFSEGVKNSTKLNIERKRVRYPRPLSSDSPLKVYNESEAYGHFLYLTNIISGGKLKRITTETDNNLPLSEIFSRDEKYLFHLIYKNKRTLLFTNTRMIFMKDMEGFRTKFDVKYSSILSVTEESSLIRIKVDRTHRFKILHPKKKKYLTIKCIGDEKHYIYQKIMDTLRIYKPATFDIEDEDNTIITPDQKKQQILQQQQQYQQYPQQIPVQYQQYKYHPYRSPYEFQGAPKFTGEKIIQPIIFHNEFGPMRTDLNPILQGLMAQQPARNIDIPIWISQSFNPPNPPDTLIPLKFRLPQQPQPQQQPIPPPTPGPQQIPYQPPPLPPPPPPPPSTRPTPLETHKSTPHVPPPESHKFTPKTVHFREPSPVIRPTGTVPQHHQPPIQHTPRYTLPSPHIPLPPPQPQYQPPPLPPPPPQNVLPPTPPPPPQPQYVIQPQTPGIDRIQQVGVGNNSILQNILQLQTIQTQQMDLLQKNQMDLEKLLLQKQTSQLDLMRAQQDQIKNIINQFGETSTNPPAGVNQISTLPPPATVKPPKKINIHQLATENPQHRQ